MPSDGAVRPSFVAGYLAPIVFSQKAILRRVRNKVREAFKNPPHWVHDFEHVKRVVGYGRRIVSEEGQSLTRDCPFSCDKFAFLVELACWLHDLGRSREVGPTFWGDKFNHAWESEKMARRMMNQIFTPGVETGPPLLFSPRGWFNQAELELVFQAVREHNQPTPVHPNNLVTRYLQDADRGDGFGYRGIIIVFNYNQIINTERKVSEKECKEAFLQVWPRILKDKSKRKRAIHWLTYITTWYTGGRALLKEGQGFGKERVCPLYTKTAKRMYYRRYLVVKRYLEELKK